MPKEKKSSKKNKPTLLRGFRDILPPETLLWQKAYAKARDILHDYGFGEINTPILEQTSLFKRTIGEYTDIVSKEMFTFADQSKSSVTMRPEMTASICRAYIEHGMLNKPQPVKLFSWGAAFRYERPQAGRFRQFNQLNIEIIGDPNSVADALVIYLSYLICKSLGLEVVMQVNSLGDNESREEYIKILKEYFKTHRRKLCDNCKERLTKNTLRLLDCKEQFCQEIVEGAPQIVDHLDEESKQHFVKVLEYLDESEVPYNLNPKIVRGLDYYNRTAFEIWPFDEENPDSQAGSQSALGGGGRYDGLIEQLGGRPTAAVGMAFGLERLLELSKKANKDKQEKEKVQIFLAQLGEKATKHSFKLFEDLRNSGLKVRADFSREGLKAQLEQADKMGAVFTVILGQKELIDGTIIIRDMENGIQEMVDLDKIIIELKKRLKK